DAPVAQDDVASGVEDGPAVTGNVITDPVTGDSDIDGDTLSVTGFTIAGEAGPFVVGAPYTITGVGTITINTNGAFAFDPAPNFNTTSGGGGGVGAGTVPVITYTLSDGSGAVNGTDTATLSLTVTNVNDAPVGVADTASGLEDGGPLNTDVTGNVLANDTDIDSAPVTFTVTGATADLDGNGTQDVLPLATPTTITDNGGTVLGTLTLNGDGSFSFDPAADYNGTDGAALPVITYTLSDNDPVLPQTGTSTLAITIGAVNDAPDAVDDAATGAEDNTITVNAATG
ncbi:MAG: Ig-like domain-containing protein, partial [Pseudomonadota bacterium]